MRGDRWKAGGSREGVEQGWGQLKKESQPTSVAFPTLSTTLSTEKSYLRHNARGISPGGNFDNQGKPGGNLRAAQILAGHK